MREKGQTEVAKTLETPVFSRGIEILTEKMRMYRIMMNGYIGLCGLIRAAMDMNIREIIF